MLNSEAGLTPKIPESDLHRVFRAQLPSFGHGWPTAGMLLTFCTRGFRLSGREAVGCNVRGFMAGCAEGVAETGVMLLAIQLSMSGS